MRGRWARHAREHAVVAEAVAAGHHARLLLRVHLAGEHELPRAETEELATLIGVHDHDHGGRVLAHAGSARPGGRIRRWLRGLLAPEGPAARLSRFPQAGTGTDGCSPLAAAMTLSARADPVAPSITAAE